MELPEGFEKKTVIVFDQRDLINLVKEVWNKKYEPANALDYPHNGSYYNYTIKKGFYDGEYLVEDEDWDDDWYDLERVIERLEGIEGIDPEENYYTPSPGDVLTALVDVGKLPEGEYILHYWW